MLSARFGTLSSVNKALKRDSGSTKATDDLLWLFRNVIKSKELLQDKRSKRSQEWLAQLEGHSREDM